MINIVFIIVCFILDMLMATVFPVDFSYQSAFFISQFSFMGLLLISKRLQFNQMIKWVVIIGIIQDIINGGHLFMSCGVNLLMVFLYRYWSNNLSGSMLEEILLLTSLIFVKETMVFTTYHSLNLLTMDYSVFFIYRLFLTCLVAPISGILIYILDGFARDWIESNKKYEDANDNLFGQQFKNK